MQAGIKSETESISFLEFNSMISGKRKGKIRQWEIYKNGFGIQSCSSLINLFYLVKNVAGLIPNQPEYLFITLISVQIF